jgi:hypothetical protein
VWFGGVEWSASWPGAVGHVPGTGNVGAAVLLAVASTGCYAASAVLQEREASRQDAAAGRRYCGGWCIGPGGGSRSLRRWPARCCTSPRWH